SEFKSRLRRWFMAQSEGVWQWPKAGLMFDGIDGASLRRALTERRSQVNAFVFHVDAELKGLIAKHDAMPPKHNLFRFILNQAELGPQGYDAVRAWIEAYEGYRPSYGLQDFGKLELIKRLSAKLAAEGHSASPAHIFSILYP